MRGSRRVARFWPAVFVLLTGVLVVGASAVGAPTRPRASAAVSAIVAASADSTPPLVPGPGPGPGGNNGPIPQIVPNKTPLASDVIKLPSARRCVKRIRVGLARPGGLRLRSATIQRGGRRITRKPAPSAITVGVLPKGRFTVRVSVTTTTGKTLRRSRRYRSCA